MKFFKHFTDAHSGRSMQAVLSEMGHAGHSVWWLLVEMCANKMEKHRDEQYTEEHCNFIFNERLLRDSLRLSYTKLERMLNQYSTLALLSFQVVGKEFHIQMPKLLESLDRDTKRARPERVQCAPKRKRKNKEKEEEREIATLSLPPLAEVWNEHCGELPKVTKTNKARNQKAENRWPENTFDEWVQIVRTISQSPFCTGKNDRGWVATFDWLCQPETHLKVSEGKYSAGPASRGNDSYLEEIFNKEPA